MTTKIYTVVGMALFFMANGFSQGIQSNKTQRNKKHIILANDQPNPSIYSIQTVNINSEYSDYAPAFYLDKLVFTSAKRNMSKIQLKYKSTGEYLTDLYLAELDAKKNPLKSENFPGMPAVKVNESTAVFTRDGKTMYFTRNNASPNDKGITTLKICRAVLVDGKWQNITDLPFNGYGFNTANPALSFDETTLYFASDRPGTLGHSDIFKVTINSDGTFGVPQNLGSAINTPEKDSFPFVSDENILYFASNGHTGRGGYDIFSSQIQNDRTFGPVFNMGPVINSADDDFSITFDPNTQIGFFASNRKGGKGGDDIYRFTKNKEMEIQETSPLIIPTKENAITENINIKNPENGLFGEITPVSPLLNNMAVSELKVQRLYFDFQNEKLKVNDEKTQKTLAYIAEIVSLYPATIFKIEGHCDNSGQQMTNQLISEKRAQNVKKELIRMGINKNSIILVKGYGESKPIETNSSPQGRSLNRRVEIIPLPAQSTMQ